MPEVPPSLMIHPKYWAMVWQILQRHVPDKEVWAFGSRVKGCAKPYSDLDLVIITETPLSWRVGADLSDAFSESDLPWRVDVLDWASIRETFRQHILRDKVVVQTPTPPPLDRS